MIKSILITGEQGSGKTTFLNKIIYEFEDNGICVQKMNHEKFKKSTKKQLLSKGKWIAIDEISSLKQFSNLIINMVDHDFRYIISTTLNDKEIPEILFCVGYVFQTNNHRLKRLNINKNEQIKRVDFKILQLLRV